MKIRMFRKLACNFVHSADYQNDQKPLWSMLLSLAGRRRTRLPHWRTSRRSSDWMKRIVRMKCIELRFASMGMEGQS